MQPNNYPVQHDLLQHFWESYVTTGRVEPTADLLPDPAVVQSWHRCRPRLDPTQPVRPKLLQPRALDTLLRAQANLITVGLPFLEDIYQYMEGSQCAVVLTDGAGCILSLFGEPQALARLEQDGLVPGSYWSEGQLGTNALSVALLEAAPIQVVGAEHYFQAMHRLVSTAAPIHSLSGRIIGLLGIVGPAEEASAHTLALVMAAARAISNQMQASLYLEEANRRLNMVNAIVETIGEGIITWDRNGNVVHLNAQAGRMFKLNPRTAISQPLHKLLRLPERLQQAIDANHPLRDAEVTFEQNGHSQQVLVSLQPILPGGTEETGYMMIMRSLEDVRTLVQHQVGMQATLNLDDVSAFSANMRPVMRQARIAARGNAPVLLRGEAGVGKNHLARAIHNESERAARPFITINCRAIPQELIIGEILGFEDSSAGQVRPSKFELAHGGTLMFDQVESLSLEMQTALLQVIETQQLMRPGGSRPVSVDVRIMAATGASLEQRVAEERFLPHLYYRFGVFSITIPPLRERLEDIPLLAERYLARITKQSGKETWLDDEAQKALRRYPWPGNVRELEGVLERALAHSQDNVIRVTNLPEIVRQGRVVTKNQPQAQPVLTTAEAEREAIIRAGMACNGRVSEMARQLGIGRTTLWRKMKRYHINRQQFSTPSSIRN